MIRSTLFSLSLCLCVLAAPDLSAAKHKKEGIKVVDLSKWEKGVYSQQGEDGIIAAIFKHIGAPTQYFVEFGAWDGEFLSNTKLLRTHLNWKGLLLDCDHEKPEINLHKAFITAENINELFAQYQVPEEFDLLSVDIDYNDFYIWKALDDKYRPRLIVMEYNSSLLPNEDKVVVYQPTHMWDFTNYFGGSILAFYNLGLKKGYTLVYADNRGVNLFFVRSDLLENRNWVFKNAGNVEKIYKAPKYGKAPDGGHSADPLNRPYVSSQELLGN